MKIQFPDNLTSRLHGILRGKAAELLNGRPIPQRQHRPVSAATRHVTADRHERSPQIFGLAIYPPLLRLLYPIQWDNALVTLADKVCQDTSLEQRPLFPIGDLFINASFTDEPARGKVLVGIGVCSPNLDSGGIAKAFPAFPQLGKDLVEVPELWPRHALG